MTTLEQKQQAAVDYGERFRESYDRMKGFEAGGFCTTASYWQPSPEPPAQEGGQHD